MTTSEYGSSFRRRSITRGLSPWGRVRVYFWRDRIDARWRSRGRGTRDPQRFFVGNAGDLMTPVIIAAEYGLEVRNSATMGSGRLFLVGSTASKAGDRDVLMGVGLRDPSLLPAQGTRILGLRGPLTYEVLKTAGLDVRDCRFLLDPGLLVGTEPYRSEVERRARLLPTRCVAFVPHYRERWSHGQLPKDWSFVDVDDDPLNVAAEILASEAVVTSSLHGMVFAHALGRTCQAVAPATSEPDFKYHDYFASISATYRPKGSIWEVRPADLLGSPLQIEVTRQAFGLPSRPPGAAGFPFPELLETWCAPGRLAARRRLE